MVGHTRTKGEIKKIVESCGYIFIKEYTKEREKRVVFKDNCGYKYNTRVCYLVKRKRIENIIDPRNSFSLENISLWLKIHKKSFVLSDNIAYVNAKTPLKFYCKKCKNIFERKWDSISGRNFDCNICSGVLISNKNSLIQLRPDLIEEWSDNNIVSINSVKIHSNKIVIWKCKKCKNEWKASINNRTGSLNSGCPYCSGKIAYDENNLAVWFPGLLLEWDYNRNGRPEDYTSKSARKVWWICKNCGHEWQAVITSRTSGRNCPICKLSKGETAIKKWLSENDIKYVSQKRFLDCKNKRFLPFDFYIPDYNYCIEYQGPQHFMILRNNIFGGEKELRERQNRDKIKREYCKNKKIKFLAISYKNYNKIENILKEKILLLGKING